MASLRGPVWLGPIRPSTFYTVIVKRIYAALDTPGTMELRQEDLRQKEWVTHKIFLPHAFFCLLGATARTETTISSQIRGNGSPAPTFQFQQSRRGNWDRIRQNSNSLSGFHTWLQVLAARR